jgi:hypothetical protein
VNQRGKRSRGEWLGLLLMNVFPLFPSLMGIAMKRHMAPQIKSSTEQELASFFIEHTKDAARNSTQQIAFHYVVQPTTLSFPQITKRPRAGHPKNLNQPSQHSGQNSSPTTPENTFMSLSLYQETHCAPALTDMIKNCRSF